MPSEWPLVKDLKEQFSPNDSFLIVGGLSNCIVVLYWVGSVVFWKEH